MNSNEIGVGSKVYRTKGAVRHVGIMLMQGRILHIAPAKDVELTDLNGFSGGHKVSFNHPPMGTDVWAVEKRATEVMRNGPVYRWWALNCEHLASYVQTGQKMSNQLQAGIAGAVAHLAMSKKPTFSGAVLSAMGALAIERAMHSSKEISKNSVNLTY